MDLSSSRRIGSLLILAFLVSAGAAMAADALNPPLTNWSMPRTWSPHSASRGLTAQADISNPFVGVAIAPCRQFDIRPGTLLDNTNLAITLTGAPCGISATVTAVSVNITVFTITGATGNGVFQVGTASNPTFAWINYPPTEAQRGNAGIVALNAFSQIVVKVNQGGGAIQLTVDVNGYFVDAGGTLNPGEFAGLEGSVGVGIFSGFNDAISGGFTSGVLGAVTGAGNTGAGVFGLQSSTSGVNFGVKGVNASGSSGAAGVFGLVEGVMYPASSFSAPVGVLGHAFTVGVLGKASATPATVARGVQGCQVDSSTGLCNTAGVLGFVSSSGGVAAGVHSFEDITAGGMKFFVVPHPEDPSKQIAYVSLEGNEAGTYFRGRSRFVNGRAVIPVPEDFQLVTEDDGLTVQITPLGRMAQVGVLSMDLNHIVVEGSRDVEFSYLVQGLRRGYAGLKPIQDNVFFVPGSPDMTMDPWPQRTKEALIRLGIYNPDGTVNLETAERLGWTKIWAERQAAEAEAREVARKNRVEAGFKSP